MLPGSDASHQCLLGRECYASSLLMTIGACVTALCLSLYAGWRDYQQAKLKEHYHHSSRARGAVVWDAGED